MSGNMIKHTHKRKQASDEIDELLKVKSVTVDMAEDAAVSELKATIASLGPATRTQQLGMTISQHASGELLIKLVDLSKHWLVFVRHAMTS